MDIKDSTTNDTTNVDDIDEGDEKDELPEYEDDEDFKRQMNEAIMRNIERLEIENNSLPVKKKTKKSLELHCPKKEKKQSNNISLGNFNLLVDDMKPKMFVSKRKQDKIGLQYKRVFNTRLQPYLTLHIAKKENVLNENEFPSL